MNPANAWLLLATRSIGIGFEPGGFGTMRPSDVAIALKGLERGKFLLGMAALVGDRDRLSDLVEAVRLEVVLPAAEFGTWKVKPRSQVYSRLATLAVFECVNKDSLDRGIRCFVCQGKGHYSPPAQIRTSAQREHQDAERRRVQQAIRRIKRLEWRAAALVDEFRELKKAGKKGDPRKLKRLKAILRWINQLSQMTELSVGQSRCSLCRGTGALILNAMHRAWLTGFSYDHWTSVWSSRYEPLQHVLDGWLSDCLTHVREAFEGRAA